MITVVITSTDIREFKGTGKTSGKPYHMRFQTGHAFVVAPDGVVAEYPDKFDIQLEEGQEPYQRGKYQLSPAALFVNRDNRLDVRPRLVPVAK